MTTAAHHDLEALEQAVEAAWERREEINPTTVGILREPVEEAIRIRTGERGEDAV